MEYTGRLITGDFEDNTMTFEIEGEMTLQAGRYKIVQIEVGNQVKNNVDLHNVIVPKGTLCISCQKEPATNGIGNRKTLCSKCWNKIAG